jgi:hypothetical protein
MSWQQRGDKRYYYRHEWINGRSVRTYQGTGAVGEMAATADALRRVEAEIEARQQRQEQQRRAAAEAPLAELCEQTDLLVDAALLRPAIIAMIVVHGGASVNTNPTAPKSETADNEELARLLERARQGDATVLPALRQFLDETPALWRDYGDLAAKVRTLWVELVSGRNLLLAESLTRQLAALTTEMAGASPSPTERLLAERVAICWLQVSYYDGLLTQTKECSPAQARLLRQQQDAAHRRYLSASKTLASVRKLLTPARSPLEIARQLAGARSELRLRGAPVEAGVPVHN